VICSVLPLHFAVFALAGSTHDCPNHITSPPTSLLCLSLNLPFPYIMKWILPAPCFSLP
jgi:hypothetical protein